MIETIRALNEQNKERILYKQNKAERIERGDKQELEAG